MAKKVENKSVVEECGCILETLFVRKFETMNLQEKIETVKTGKPTPLLPNLFYQTKKFTRHFHESNYKEYTWLCGCKKTNRLYCWPCILFSLHDMWTVQGVNDLSNLTNLLKKHSLSKPHFRSSFNLVKFRNKHTDNILKKSCNENIIKYNDIVKNNRHVMNRIIDAICYLVEQDLSLDVVDKKSTLNMRNYEQLMNLLGKSDPIFYNHINIYTVFKTSSNDIQSDLINSIAETMTNEIKAELDETKFITIILGGSTCSTKKYYFSTVLRYVTKQGIKERFIKFLAINKDRPVNSIANNVVTLLNQFQYKEKLVAQSFDGAMMATAGHKHLEELIKSSYKDAMYLQHYAHKLNLILVESLNIFKQCRTFFETLCSLREFFTDSPKRTNLLERMIEKSFPNVAPTSWNYVSSVIEVIMNVKEELLIVFNTIAANKDEWDFETRCCAKSYYNLLKEVEFNFLLNLFWTLFQKCEMLYTITQSNIYNIDYCERSVIEFQNNLVELRNNFDGMWPINQMLAPIPQKRMRLSENENGDSKTVYRKLFHQIIDIVIENVKNIYANMKSLKFLSLLNFDRFQEYTQQFPEDMFNGLFKYYGKHFDYVYLKRELMETYAGEEFKKNSILQLYRYLQDTSLAEVLPETTKLCALFLTLPIVNPSTNEQNKDQQHLLDRIRKYLAVVRNQDIFNGLSMLAIEMEFFKDTMMKPNFHDTVRDMFTLKNQHIELTYK